MTVTRFSTAQPAYVAGIRRTVSPDAALTLPGDWIPQMTSSADMRLIADSILTVLSLTSDGVKRLTADRQLVEFCPAVSVTVSDVIRDGIVQVDIDPLADLEDTPVVIDDGQDLLPTPQAVNVDTAPAVETSVTEIAAPAAPTEPLVEEVHVSEAQNAEVQAVSENVLAQDVQPAVVDAPAAEAAPEAATPADTPTVA